MISLLKSIVKIFIDPFLVSFLIFKLQKKYKTLKISGRIQVKNSQFGLYNYLENAQISNSFLDDFSYVGSNSYVNNSTIGKFTCIGPNVKVGLGEHPTKIFVSVHPIFYSKSKQVGLSFVDENYFQEFNRTEIGHDVWIGANVIIRGGVKIGNGAIIASGSVVTKNVGHYEVVGGVPSKVIKRRFDDQTIQSLLKFQWWAKDLSWLKININRFHNVKNFFKDENNI